jgi:hypothetical protein
VQISLKNQTFFTQIPYFEAKIVNERWNFFGYLKNERNMPTKNQKSDTES